MTYTMAWLKLSLSPSGANAGSGGAAFFAGRAAVFAFFAVVFFALPAGRVFFFAFFTDTFAMADLSCDVARYST